MWKTVHSSVHTYTSGPHFCFSSRYDSQYAFGVCFVRDCARARVHTSHIGHATAIPPKLSISNASNKANEQWMSQWRSDCWNSNIFISCILLIIIFQLYYTAKCSSVLMERYQWLNNWWMVIEWTKWKKKRMHSKLWSGHNSYCMNMFSCNIIHFAYEYKFPINLPLPGCGFVRSQLSGIFTFRNALGCRVILLIWCLEADWFGNLVQSQQWMRFCTRSLRH